MAQTWVRNGTGTLPSGTNADVTGTIELDNGTAPFGFDPTNINSVRIEYRMEIGSGSFTAPEHHIVLKAVLLTLNGNGSTMASVDGTNETITVSTFFRDTDEIDNSPSQAFSVAQWETAELNPTATWTTFSQSMGPDGVLIQIASTGLVVTVTVDYTGLGFAETLTDAVGVTDIVTSFSPIPNYPPYLPLKNIYTRM